MEGEIKEMKKDLYATHVKIGGPSQLFSPTSREAFIPNQQGRDVGEDRKNNDKLATFLKKEKF